MSNTRQVHNREFTRAAQGLDQIAALAAAVCCEPLCDVQKSLKGRAAY
jgi:hypothetical protein